MPPPLRFLGFTVLMLGLGTMGGAVLSLVGFPMPFMLGSLAATAICVGVGEDRFPQGYQFPMRLRLIFIGVIGVMIGSRVTPELMSQVPDLAVSFLVVILFVVLAQVMNYQVFRRLGGYDRATAYFSSSPGGLIESITMGEAAGGDVRVLTLQQFLRIILVVSILPIALSIWHGAPVGSAAGLSFSSGQMDGGQMVLVIGLALAGLGVGRVLHLPAWQLMGPLLVAAVLSGFDVVSLTLAPWLIATAQVVLGVSLGLRFVGISRSLLVKGVGLSLVSVLSMLALGGVLAGIVHQLIEVPLDVLMISYAPGGVTEMGLIALSLSANPAFVTLHHLFRITLTVVMLSLARRFGIMRL